MPFAIFHFWQSGTFEPLYEIQNFFGHKDPYESVIDKENPENVPGSAKFMIRVITKVQKMIF